MRRDGHTDMACRSKRLDPTVWLDGGVAMRIPVGGRRTLPQNGFQVGIGVSLR